MSNSPRTLCVFLAGLAFALSPSAGRSAVVRPEPLTLPSTAPLEEVVRAFLASDAARFGAAAEDLAAARVTDVVPTRHNGLRHVYLRQSLDGLEIDGTELAVHVDRLGRVVHFTGAALDRLAERADAIYRVPDLGPDEAVLAAARRLALPDVVGLDVLDAPGGVDRAVRFANPELSEVPIPVRLRYHREAPSDRLRLTWNLSLKPPGGSAWLELWIDAVSGQVVDLSDWTDDATYSVFASPKESPEDGPRSDEIDPYLAGGIASPFGWHDTNGAPGAETTLTSGNNVNACTDIDANNVCDAGSQPDGGGSLLFQPPLDLDTQQPAAYRPAAVVNLYYWNNFFHDVLYQYGFDEPGGNFQLNNYGRGGLANDRVNADAQDGSGTNNANFSTPPDGSAPRMQMFVWNSPLALLVNAPPAVAGSYVAGTATFGPQSFNLTQDVVVVNDGSGTVTDDGCCNDGNTLCVAPVWPGVPGKIALLRRGQCEFGTKTVNAQNAGAVGVILANNQGGDAVISMGPGVNGGAAVIPIVSIGQNNGNLLFANATGLNATMNSTVQMELNRDSDLDNGVIVHEYGHGVSNRLTGGPGVVTCLDNVEQAGEGWSDWMTLFLHAAPSDTRTTPRPVGYYVNFDSLVNGIGIRRYPYTTDNTVNPLTYGGIADTGNSQPHGIGAIWATMLWEMYWNLVDVYGYDPDLYGGTGGNNLAFQLVIDGMKLQPCEPSFPQARDAILAADLANYENENYCEIWRAFAERGVGTAATTGASTNDRIVTEDFTLPAECVDLIFSDGFGMGNFSRWSSRVGG